MARLRGFGGVCVEGPASMSCPCLYYYSLVY